MKVFIRISLVSFVLMMFFLPAASAETLQEQLNNLIGPKQKYNTMLSPAYLRNNETVEEISPQSGSLTITQTDYVLPGRNGLNLEFKRIYKNEAANVQEMEVNYIDGAWVDKSFSNSRTSSFYEDRYNLGIGMRFSFPSIEVKVNSDGSSHKFLHTESGDVYRLKSANLEGSYVYLPEGQTVKDVVVGETTTYQNGQADGISKYKMTGKDGKSTYFSEDGRILGVVDRYGNTINFEYNTLKYSIDGDSITKKLISKITDSVGRTTTIEYLEDHNYTVGPISSDSPVGTDDYYKASQSPNNTDSGDLKGRFQVIVHLPGDKSIVYDKSAALVSYSKHVVRTRLQRVYDTDTQPKFMFWYEQPDLGFTYFNKDNYSAYIRYENLVLVDEVKNNKAKSYVYNTYTKRLNEGSMQYRKVFESNDLAKKGYDASKSNFLDKFITDTYNKRTYTYTNEADGYGKTDYKQDDKTYLKDTYRYYTQIKDANNSTTRFTYNGNQELIISEKEGKDHKESITNEHDEMKLVKKQETLQYQVVNSQTTGEPVKKIENFRYDEYGNMTSYTGPDAERDEKGYPINNERSSLFTYDVNKFHILTQKTWKQDHDTTAQINYTLDDKGNVIKESKSNNDSAYPWIITEYKYDNYGNLTRKTTHDSKQDFINRYEYGTNTKGAYLTKEYQESEGKVYAQTFTYDFQTGNLLTKTDAKGNITAYEYDVLNRVIKDIKPDKTLNEYKYQTNSFSNFQIQHIDGNQSKFQYEYDIQGNQLYSKVWYQGGWKNLTSMEYDSFGNITKQIDANGHSARFSYDSQQRVIEKSYYENDKTAKGTMKIEYRIGADAQTPLLLTITNEEGYKQRFYYDILSQLIKKEVASDHKDYYASTTTYDYVGNTLSQTNERKQTTTYMYDPQGKKISQTDAEGNTAEFVYNALGQVILEKAPDGKITEWTYDEIGRNTAQKIYQSGSKDYYYYLNEYDAAHNPVKTTTGVHLNGKNQDSSIVSYTYDSLNRVTDQYSKLDTATSNRTHFDYDANGNKVKIIEYGDSAGTKLVVRSFEYDFAGRTKHETGSAKEKLPDGSLERGSYETKFEYDLVGNLLKKQQFNGSGYDTETNEYNYRNLVVSSNKPFNTHGQKVSRYQYDKVGNLTSDTTTVSGKERTTTYAYNGLGYKTAVIDPLGNKTRYQYDSMGNLLKVVDPRYSTTSIEQAPGIEKEYDGLNRLIKTIAFDGTQREVIDYREYDGRNNVVKQSDGEGYNVAQPEKSIGTLYRYNVLDKPIELITAQTMYENQQLGTSNFTKKLTYDASGNVLSETDGLGQKSLYDYDLGGRLKQIIYPDGTVTSTEYDLTGKWVILNKDQVGSITKTYNNIFDKPYLIEHFA
ncbi:RHS repeat protein [Paenibacillus albidus]|uniref:hypothetical protein n=1 Tax=Paenibacillus albidus TaxID=2041023 RepID=UPI001BE6E270|nr:hypothetical protein [Paenibacillus albidus]MBT2291031.1 RHS repeat protein [Paenibacillus albidus]